MRSAARWASGAIFGGYFGTRKRSAAAVVLFLLGSLKSTKKGVAARSDQIGGAGFTMMVSSGCYYGGVPGRALGQPRRLPFWGHPLGSEEIGVFLGVWRLLGCVFGFLADSG